MFGDIRYDPEQNEWFIICEEYDESTGEFYQVEKIYVPEITEYDINKNIKKFMKSENKQFVFSPTTLYVGINNDRGTYNIELREIAEDVVIYDKYLTQESIYIDSDIGKKNLWTCSSPIVYNENFLEYGFAEDNLYYELVDSLYMFLDSDFIMKYSLEAYRKKSIEILNDKLEKYKQIARNNPNNFYVVYLCVNYDQDYDVNQSDILIANTYERIAYVDIAYKDVAIEKIKECYRYHNLGFYRSALILAYDGGEYGEIGPSVQWQGETQNSEQKIYNLNTYIISESATRKLEKSEIQNLSLDELNKAYNEIFARHGHEFKGAELKEYFSNQSWYNPIPNKTVTLEELNEIEKYNLDIIKSVIAEKKNT